MIVGCYVLDLYCDNEGKYPDGIHEYNQFPRQITGGTRQGCDRIARKEGWIINYKKGVALCPKCSGKSKKEKK